MLLLATLIVVVLMVTSVAERMAIIMVVGRVMNGNCWHLQR